ncbi:MAG: YHYH protein [Actinomycetota bacterium]
MDHTIPDKMLMGGLRTRISVGAAVLALALLPACGGDDSIESAVTDSGAVETSLAEADDDANGHDDAHSHEDDEAHTHDEVGIDTAMFLDGALAEEPTQVDCTLTDGTQTTCLELTVVGYPVDEGVGEFCPTTIDATADDVGIWFDGSAVYDIDGDFILGLAELYDDNNWQLHNDDGTVNVTDTEEAFDAAARPDVDPDYQNHCVEGQIAWLPDGEPIATTVTIPLEPVDTTTPSDTGRDNLGVTVNGVVIANSAPVDAILSAYTIAAFDDCGGHINPIDGYHLHGHTDCGEVAMESHAALIGYALDGYAIYAATDASDLDACGGHTDDVLGYHYHAAETHENAVISCFTGAIAR